MLICSLGVITIDSLVKAWSRTWCVCVCVIHRERERERVFGEVDSDEGVYGLSGHPYKRTVPTRQDITMAWLADSSVVLIKKSMSICASSSPGRLPAQLKSPNEAWSRYLIPESRSQSDFATEVIHPEGPGPGRRAGSSRSMQHVYVVLDFNSKTQNCCIFLFVYAFFFIKVC